MAGRASDSKRPPDRGTQWCASVVGRAPPRFGLGPARRRSSIAVDRTPRCCGVIFAAYGCSGCSTVPQAAVGLQSLHVGKAGAQSFQHGDRPASLRPTGLGRP